VDETTSAAPVDEAGASTAGLEHLTGPARGTMTWLPAEALDICTPGGHILRVAAANQCGDRMLLARLHPADDGFEIEACPDSPLWVNGDRVESKHLEHGDLVEFGEQGPLCRYYLSAGGKPVRKTLMEIISDSADYFRVSRKPVSQKLGRASRNMGASLSRQTTIFFRAGVIVALAVAVFFQFQSSRQLDRDLEQASTRIEVLEQQSAAVREVISNAAQSVIFLQGAFGYRETETGNMLRYAVDEEGNVLRLPMGPPVLTLEGDGPVAENNFTGTSFVLADGGLMLSNRHVALPWEQDVRLETMSKRGLEPVMISFRGYAPGTDSAFDVETGEVSEEADLVLLHSEGLEKAGSGLVLGDEQPGPGSRVIVMGYPTGLRALLARAGEDFIEKIDDEDDVDYHKLADELARAGHIKPLSSLGIVAQVSDSALVYDADTTHGGSGGPVLNMKGEVVAVNAAIIPGYTGSNIGVPVRFVRELLSK